MKEKLTHKKITTYILKPLMFALRQNPELDLFDVVVSTETVYHDVAPNILTGFHPWLVIIYFHTVYYRYG